MTAALQERARLEQAVEDKIAAERRAQLQRKRKEQEQRLQEQVCCAARSPATARGRHRARAERDHLHHMSIMTTCITCPSWPPAL